MSTFAIYKYDFRLSNEENIFVKGTTDKLLDKAQELFNGLIHGERPFPLVHMKRDKTEVPLENEVMIKRDRVSVLLVCNEKHKKYQDKKDDKDLEYHPGCYVIIDNRDGIANIAIERTSAFDNNTDRVCELLQQAINKTFFAQGIMLNIEIRSKVNEASLWEIVKHQVSNFNDRITKVVFNFPVPGKIAGIDASNAMKDKLAIMSSIAGELNGAKGSYHIEADKGASLRLEQTQEDLSQMVHLCSRNVYDIHVHFQRYGIYRFGADEKALSSLKDDVIEQFINGHSAFMSNGEQSFNLLQWLDDVRKITENYKDVLPTAKKRKRSYKEAV